MTGAIGLEGSDAAAQVLEAIQRELVAQLGGGLDPRAVRVDVDVFDGAEPLVADCWLDSMSLVQLIAAIEDRFGVGLATLVTGDEPVTLAHVARHIERGLS